MIDRLYRLASVFIVVSIVMLCQPFSISVHVWAFPVLLAGVVMFLILDHLPHSWAVPGSRPTDQGPATSEQEMLP
jgi:hypothetical protein